jgi:hypothetical protein
LPWPARWRSAEYCRLTPSVTPPALTNTSLRPGSAGRPARLLDQVLERHIDVGDLPQVDHGRFQRVGCRNGCDQTPEVDDVLRLHPVRELDQRDRVGLVYRFGKHHGLPASAPI